MNFLIDYEEKGSTLKTLWDILYSGLHSNVFFYIFASQIVGDNLRCTEKIFQQRNVRGNVIFDRETSCVRSSTINFVSMILIITQSAAA